MWHWVLPLCEKSSSSTKALPFPRPHQAAQTPEAPGGQAAEAGRTQLAGGPSAAGSDPQPLGCASERGEAWRGSLVSGRRGYLPPPHPLRINVEDKMMELWFNLVLTPPRLAQSLALLHRCPERGLGHLGEILSHLIWAQYTNLQLLTQQSY